MLMLEPQISFIFSDYGDQELVTEGDGLTAQQSHPGVRPAVRTY